MPITEKNELAASLCLIEQCCKTVIEVEMNLCDLQALPIFLRRLIDDVTAIVLSVTVVLIFGTFP